ncbi:hypothetical protein AURDEDRAFT_168955 [Auricularia subglabra TFB-10046 SS5]|nr:hypothetical protein AURDEDRAFT_168955 [Auricularia subglabra TFB-10046 SS5]
MSGYPSRASAHTEWQQTKVDGVASLYIYGVGDEHLGTPEQMRSKTHALATRLNDAEIVEHAGCHFTPSRWPFEETPPRHMDGLLVVAHEFRSKRASEHEDDTVFATCWLALYELNSTYILRQLLRARNTASGWTYRPSRWPTASGIHGRFHNPESRPDKATPRKSTPPPPCQRALPAPREDEPNGALPQRATSRRVCSVPRDADPTAAILSDGDGMRN